jgi:hypothetical protein
VAYAESVLKSAAPLDEQLADLEAYIGSVPSVAAGRFASWLRGGPSNGEGSEWTEGLS